MNVLLLEEEIGSTLRKLLTNFFVQIKIHLKTEMISNGAVLRNFLQWKMTFVINLSNHTIDCPS